MRAFAFIVPWMIRAGDDMTSVTRALNDMIATSGDGCVYCGGRGVVIRNPFDDYQDDQGKSVVPATFWVNDIQVPSQIYPDIDWGEEIADACYRASVAFVIGTNIGELFPDVDNLQDDDWGWGVFYATDANAVDTRCRWLQSDNYYDCPKGGFSGDDLGTFIWDDHLGSGWYGSGNPYAGLGGGGTGNHFNNLDHIMDQEQARDANGVALIGNWDAQCNFDLKGNGWSDWVDHWFTYGNRWAGVDSAICWVNSPRDLIHLQNMIYWKSDADSGPGFPKPGIPAVQNWGWNEIPLDRVALGNPFNWDAVVIHLPAEICGEGGQNDYVDCLAIDAQWRLESTLDKWVGAGYLWPGLENVGNRPGSYVVFVREFRGDNGGWFRWFFCSYWRSPGSKYDIVSYPDGNNDGACVIEWSVLSSAQSSKERMV